MGGCCCKGADQAAKADADFGQKVAKPMVATYVPSRVVDGESCPCTTSTSCCSSGAMKGGKAPYPLPIRSMASQDEGAWDWPGCPVLVTEELDSQGRPSQVSGAKTKDASTQTGRESKAKGQPEAENDVTPEEGMKGQPVEGQVGEDYAQHGGGSKCGPEEKENGPISLEHRHCDRLLEKHQVKRAPWKQPVFKHVRKLRPGVDPIPEIEEPPMPESPIIRIKTDVGLPVTQVVLASTGGRTNQPRLTESAAMVKTTSKATRAAAEKAFKTAETAAETASKAATSCQQVVDERVTTATTSCSNAMNKVLRQADQTAESSARCVNSGVSRVTKTLDGALLKEDKTMDLCVGQTLDAVESTCACPSILFGDAQTAKVWRESASNGQDIDCAPEGGSQAKLDDRKGRVIRAEVKMKASPTKAFKK